MKKAYKWTIALILLGFVLTGIFLTIAPDQIPAHYNIRGEVDRWGSKYEFLVMPVINLLFGIFMAWLARFEGKKGRDMNERIVSTMNNWILVLFNGLWLLFMWKAADARDPGGDLGDLTTKIFLMLMMASFIPMGNIMPKAQRNSAFGLRTKWSTANDHCWQQSQRIGGYIMVATGFVGVIFTAVLPAAWGGYAMLALIIVMAIGSTWASYRIYMRSQVQ
ncbi:MAG: DUF1648 domain-containing protein [Oscillospiraceae bacterium]|nr:DUF1648 domain-containing protein [Oscillospiraceae bacterium]